MKCQLAGLQVAADQQGAPRGRGGQPGPGIPPLAFGPRSRGADFLALPALQQLLHRLRAGRRGAGRESEGEVRGDAKDVGLAAAFRNSRREVQAP